MSKEDEKYKNSIVSIHGDIACEFANWIDRHTHFWRPLNAKLWYDKSKWYGERGCTTEELFELFLEDNYKSIEKQQCKHEKREFIAHGCYCHECNKTYLEKARFKE